MEKAAEERAAEAAAAEVKAAKSKEMGDSTQVDKDVEFDAVEFDAVNEDIVKRLKLEIDLEISAQHGHLLDDHQSPVSAEHYSAPSRQPMHVHATCTRPHLTPHPVLHELLTHTNLLTHAQHFSPV